MTPMGCDTDSGSIPDELMDVFQSNLLVPTSLHFFASVIFKGYMSGTSAPHLQRQKMHLLLLRTFYGLCGREN
jgi:hypothetical protein